MEFLRGMTHGWIKGCWLLGAALLLFAASARGQSAPTEADIQAAYVFNFAKFVEWPAETLRATNSPIRIGVLGSADQLAGALKKTVSGKKIDAHPVELEFFDELPESPPHILFIAGDRRQARRVLSRVNSQPILTVGNQAGFCQAGGVINFQLQNSKVRFEINPKAAEQQRLKLSSKLMSVAVRLAETESEQ